MQKKVLAWVWSERFKVQLIFTIAFQCKCNIQGCFESHSTKNVSFMIIQCKGMCFSNNILIRMQKLASYFSLEVFTKYYPLYFLALSYPASPIFNMKPPEVLNQEREVRVILNEGEKISLCCKRILLLKINDNEPKALNISCLNN